MKKLRLIIFMILVYSPVLAQTSITETKISFDTIMESSKRSDNVNLFELGANSKKKTDNLLDGITAHTEPKKVSTKTSKTQLDVAELMTYCEQAVKKQLKDPSSLDISWLSRKIKNIDGLQAISFEFTATNSFGGRIKNNAECGFENGELIFAHIGYDI